MVFTEDNKERCASVEQIVQCRKSSQNRIVICACALSTTSLCACADGSCRHPGSCTHSYIINQGSFLQRERAGKAGFELLRALDWSIVAVVA